MATFSATVYQNEFLPDGGTDVNAIVRVGVQGAGRAGAGSGGPAGEIVIIDADGHETGRWYTPRHRDAKLSYFDLVPQETLFWRRRVYERAGGIDRMTILAPGFGETISRSGAF